MKKYLHNLILGENTRMIIIAAFIGLATGTIPECLFHDQALSR